jgi:hypothetical protein
MADSRTYEKSRSTTLAINSEESSEICIGCAEVELELKKTQIELTAAEKTVELLCKEIKQTEDALTQCSRNLINKCNQEVNEISQCSKCVESEVKHQNALLEIRSLQSINKLLYKLGMSVTKSEVMADTETMVVNTVLKNSQESQEAPTTKLDSVDDRHLSRNPKYRRIPVIVNGLVNSPCLESDRKVIHCNKISNVQKTSGNSAVNKDVRKVVILGDSHSRGLSVKLKMSF